jgi:hypothetical protein
MATWGIGRRHMASPNMVMWAHGPLPRPFASYTPFLYIFCEISCIQIYFPVQVELGEIISKFSTCDDDFPYFILLFGEILMVLMGVSDHQQPS